MKIGAVDTRCLAWRVAVLLLILLQLQQLQQAQAQNKPRKRPPPPPKIASVCSTCISYQLEPPKAAATNPPFTLNPKACSAAQKLISGSFNLQLEARGRLQNKFTVNSKLCEPLKASTCGSFFYSSSNDKQFYESWIRTSAAVWLGNLQVCKGLTQGYRFSVSLNNTRAGGSCPSAFDGLVCDPGKIN